MNINPKHFSKRVFLTALVVLLASALLLQSSVQKASAGKEGVYFNSEAYIGLEEARLSPGTDSQTFRFTLQVNNPSSSTLNYNAYGVAVIDGAGNRYAAELAEKANAIIKPNTTVTVKYVSKLPAGVAFADLKVQIFAWSFGSSQFFNVLGELSAASVASAGQSQKPETVFNLHDADSSYPADALVGIQLEDSFKVLDAGVWNLYVHATVENMSSSSFKLPTALQASLKDQAGLSYEGAIISGGDKSILPKQSQPVVLQFPIGTLEDERPLTLEFGRQAVSSTNSSSGSSTELSAVTLGALDLTDAHKATPVEEERPYGGQFSLSAETSSVSVSAKSDGVHLKTVWTLLNTGNQAVAVPSLSGSYQLKGSTLQVAATDALSHPVYLAAGESTDYRFEAVLPSGVDASQVQLAVGETQNSLWTPVFLAALPDGTQSGGSGADATGSAYYTSVGKLDLSIKSSYRLATDSGEDVLMTELQVQNLESTVVTLPEMYAGYTDGDLEVTGEAARVQTSAFLNPGEKTTLYLYAKLPYRVALDSGYVYFGEGELDEKTNTITESKEWARLAFQISNQAETEVSEYQSWFISDPGRQSVAQVIDSKVYETETGSIVAVRVAQKNQEDRTNTPVPYLGYFLDQTGSAWAANVNQQTGRVNKDGWSLATLWIETSSAADEFTSLVLGPQVKDDVFSSPHKVNIYPYEENPTSVKLDSSDSFKAQLLPYNISFTSMTPSISGQNYEFNFTYKVEKDVVLTSGSLANRGFYIELTDSSGNTYKTWDIPLEGTGSFSQNSTNKLTVENLSVSQLVILLDSAKFTIYETFEGGKRPLGTISSY